MPSHAGGSSDQHIRAMPPPKCSTLPPAGESEVEPGMRRMSGPLLARRGRTIGMCSLDARGQGSMMPLSR